MKLALAVLLVCGTAAAAPKLVETSYAGITMSVPAGWDVEHIDAPSSTMFRVRQDPKDWYAPAMVVSVGRRGNLFSLKEVIADLVTNGGLDKDATVTKRKAIRGGTLLVVSHGADKYRVIAVRVKGEEKAFVTLEVDEDSLEKVGGEQLVATVFESIKVAPAKKP